MSRRIGLSQIAANGLGAIDLFVLLAWVLPSPEHAATPEALVLERNAIAFAVYLPLSLAGGTALGLRAWRPTARWLAAERAPDEAERAAALSHPLRCASITATFWLGGLVLFAALNATVSGELSVHVATTVLMGGLTTTAMAYLITEWLQRPVTARALATGPPVRPVGPGVKGRLVLAWLMATGVPLLGLLMLGCHVLFEGGVSASRMAASVVALSGVALTTGLVATVLVARSVADPLTAVRRALGRIEAGDLGAAVPVSDGSEVGLLQSGFNRMVAGLRERERLRELFGRHVGEDVARRALDGEAALGGEVREVAVLFVDMVGSTALAASSPPGEVVARLNRFFAIVVDVVADHGGWVNKFEGDSALCVFGAPAPCDDAAGAALASGRELRRRMSREMREADAGIGLSAGPAVAGNVGAEQRFEYTVIGDPVNEAARLCELAKRRPERIIASEAIVSRASRDEASRWAVGEAAQLRGRPSPTRLALPADG